MKSPEQLHKELVKKLITENYVDLHPISTFEATPKLDFEKKFAQFLNEKKGDLSELQPIVNTNESTNTLKDSEGISADSKAKFEGEGFQASYKVDKTVENIDSHNYDYKSENINNVNAQEVLTGIQCEINYNKELTLDEAKEIAVKNLAKDPLHYVKEGQFGVEGLGYTEAKTQKADGKHAASGYSEKLKESDNVYSLVKEHLGGVVTTGHNPWVAVVNDIINEKEDEKKLPMDEMEDEGTSVSYSDATEARQKAIETSQKEAGMSEEARPDYPDIDGDGDTKEPMVKAAQDKKKKTKKESIDSKLAEIGKAGDITRLEAQLEFLSDHINEKTDRVNSISEDENLSELIDKKKMKDMQKEIKLLEKKKAGMEKMYEKMAGKKYQKTEVVDEADEVSWNEKNNPTRGAAGERDPKQVGQSVSDYAVNK